MNSHACARVDAPGTLRCEGEQTGLSGFGELVVSMAMMTDADACDVEPAAKRHRPDLTEDEAGQLLRDAVPKKTRQSTEFWVCVVKGFSSGKRP